MNQIAVKYVNRMFILAAAPFLGIVIWLLAVHFSVQLPNLAPLIGEPFSFHNETKTVETRLDLAKADALQTKSIIQSYFKLYEQTSLQAAALLTTVTNQAVIPNAVFDLRIAAKLGNPNGQASSGNIDLKLYSLYESAYQGYAMKVNLKSDKAMNLVIGYDKLGSGETTLSAAQRYGAVAGINAGGFADDSRGRRFPLDTTVMNGRYLSGFFPSNNATTFIGISKDRKLIGGQFYSQAELDKQNPMIGSTFVPTLLKNGQKIGIPAQWQTSPARAARTVIGNYKNDQLLVLVIEGRNENGNSGATLAELQDKLLQLGVRDAYNLDGGGSTTLVFNGNVINHPSDGRLRPLATNFLFFK